MTVCEIVALYLRHCEVEGVHGPEAREDRERTLGWLVADMGDLPVPELRPYHLTDWVEAHPRWKSVSTRRAKSNAVRACFQWAADQERIPKNPFASVRYAEAERRPELPDLDLDRIGSLANKQFETVVRFLRLTGCRLSELCRAKWCDVNLDRGLWLIPKHKSRKHTGRAKLIALVDDAMSLLRGLAAVAGAAARCPGAAVVDVLPAGGGYVFLNTRGQQWTSGALGEALRRLKRRHGIDTPATLHGIRHRMATACIANGAPIKLVAEQLGHASVTMTERYYHSGEQNIDAIREAAQRGVPKK